MQPIEVVEVLTLRLKKLMAEHRVKAAPLARAANLNESAVRDILRGRSKNPGIVTLQKIASVMNLRPSALFEAGEKWQVMGTVVEGGIVKEVGAIDEDDLFIENPCFVQLPGRLAALHVGDDGLAPFAFKGDHLIYREDFGASELDSEGRPSFCELEDGRRLVRLLRPTSDADSYTLLPVNPYAVPETQTRIRRASSIVMVVPNWLVGPVKKPTHVASMTVQESQASYSAAGKK